MDNLMTTTLANGRTVKIEEFELFCTFRSLIFGTPWVVTNTDKHREKWWPDGKGLLILPHENVPHPTRKGPVPRSPRYTLVADLVSAPIKDISCASLLRIVWMVETLPDNLLGALAEAIHGIDWSLALDFDY